MYAVPGGAYLQMGTIDSKIRKRYNIFAKKEGIP